MGILGVLGIGLLVDYGVVLWDNKKIRGFRGCSLGLTCVRSLCKGWMDLLGFFGIRIKLGIIMSLGKC